MGGGGRVGRGGGLGFELMSRSGWVSGRGGEEGGRGGGREEMYEEVGVSY